MKSGEDALQSNESPTDLVARIAAGDATAEDAFYRRYSRSIMTMLRNRVGDVQHAEDVHQDTFIIVLDRLRRNDISDPSKVAAFLHKTAVNVLIGNIRKETRRQTYADSDRIERVLDDRDNHIEVLIRDESRDAVRQLIEELKNERDRQLILRFYVLQQDKPLICDALDLTSVHFDRVISRARKRFRELVLRQEPELAASN
ncbi:MAG: sigma-70 family RNA polymerase sigma factor [Pseudomonadota bacterium]